MPPAGVFQTRKKPGRAGICVVRVVCAFEGGYGRAARAAVAVAHVQELMKAAR